VLTRIQAQAVRDIKIAQPNTPTVELVRSGAVWQMIAPDKLPADQFAVKSLLDSLPAVIQSSFPAVPARLARYGLDPARARLWINGMEFDFGDTEPLNNYRYVLSGGQVHLVSGLLFYRVNHGPYWWVSKRLLPDNAKITALQLPDATLSLKGDHWQLAPANPAVSADAIQTLVDNWQDAQAIGVAKARTGKPVGEVAIELAGGKSALRFAILKDPNFSCWRDLTSASNTSWTAASATPCSRSNYQVPPRKRPARPKSSTLKDQPLPPASNPRRYRAERNVRRKSERIAFQFLHCVCRLPKHPESERLTQSLLRRHPHAGTAGSRNCTPRY